MKTITDENIKFLLKDPRADRPTLISLVYRYNNTRFVYSTGLTIDPYQWNTEDQRAYTNQKGRADRETYQTINAGLDRHRAALKKILTRLQLATVSLDNTILKQHLNAELGHVQKIKPAPVVVTAQETFMQFIERFVDEGRAGRRLNAKSTHYSPYTLAGYLKLKRLLQDYSNATGQKIDYPAYSLEFYNNFKGWLTGRGLTLNYVGSLMKDLKVMLKQAHGDGLHTNTIFEHKDFKKFSEDVDSVYLTETELTKLYNLNLTSTPGLDKARDLFLIGCYTGLRFSDFMHLRAENIKDRILTRNTLKTSERVSIPLNSKVLAIVAKYNGVPPRPISNQRLNDHLKELCKRAGLTERIEVSRTKGGANETRYPAKWELVGTHTARRSFATNAYLAKVPPVAIMKITGHRSEKMLLRYIKISSQENAVMLLDHAHFQ
ncbi:site-specific integrase [Spirosoma fluviale]|uniref:Phage integrase SAM-like domain-containing protein n=1 Tax=Spirosoma fluviale TaxID=1597977 RepID=A0A286GMV0_9BACT|nr:site-specific integrase [Spirosoma fluviale]SOD96409.1 Phage integrase SAM-like domain-containing protein [Spirosoma fluviale]